MADVREATEQIWRAAQRGEFYPAAWRGKLTLEEGYRVQLGILARHVAAGDRQAGWKVGLTAKAIRDQLGVHEPVLGFLLASGQKPSGVSIPFSSLISPCVENELCLTVGTALRGPGVTVAQARAALTAAAPAFELVERRGDFVADMALAGADNVQQKAFITAPAQALPPGQHLAATTLAVSVNGRMVERATGAEVMGDPAASVAWLANKLAEFGLAVEAGQQIMSGSFTRQVELAPGMQVEARFSPFGTVTARFP
jgi:2-keto-4-pentenoate hydratase